MNQNEFAEFAGPSLRTFQRIADAWRLAPAQRARMLDLDERAYAALLDQPECLARERLSRIGHVLGIYKALHTLFPQPLQADGWIWRANAATGLQGRPALERMLESEDGLVWVRRYLDGMVHG